MPHALHLATKAYSSHLRPSRLTPRQSKVTTQPKRNKNNMKTKATHPRTIESLRTIGHLRPTQQRNNRRPRLNPDDRFTLWCMVAAVAGSVLVWLVG